MGVDVDILILGPFREVVDRGREALANASVVTGHDGVDRATLMAKASQDVVKEGERALRRLQPLWDGQLDRDGDAFRHALSTNEQVGQTRRALADLLYDLEDFVRVDTFDAELFTEVQSATRAFALHLIDFANKTRLEMAVPSAHSPLEFRFRPLPPLPPKALKRAVSSAAVLGTPTLAPEQSPMSHRLRDDRSEGSTSQRPPLPPKSPRRQLQSEKHASISSVVSSGPFVRPLRLPPVKRDRHPLHMNPPRPAWSTASSGTARSRISQDSAGSVESQPPPAYTVSGEAMAPSLSSDSKDASSAVGLLLSTAATSPGQVTAWTTDPTSPSHGQRPASCDDPRSPRTMLTAQQPSVPENKAVGVFVPRHSSLDLDGPLGQMISQLGTSSLAAASRPSCSPDGEKLWSSSQSQSSSLCSSHSMSSHTAFEACHPFSLPGPDKTFKKWRNPLARPTCQPPVLSSTTTVQPVLSTKAADQASREIRAGTPAVTYLYPAALSCSSQSDTEMTASSSLYSLSGFCSGAQLFRSTMHQDGVRRVAGYVAGASTATGRCDGCSYGHAFAELDLDVNTYSPRATFSRSEHGVLFRIRLLYKSHVDASRPNEAFYGCLFCAQTGHVVREGDATVFRNSDDLLRHLARHPRPLPDVYGVTVLYGKEVLATDARANDFDLWLTEEEPEVPPEVPGLSQLPVATAIKSHVQRYGEQELSRPQGKGMLLQFFVGARIVGIEFAPAYEGRWCTGWHDGEWGYFPSKLVRLERPRNAALHAQSSDMTTSAVARWRWNLGDKKKGWIGFHKGERITNVSFVEGMDGWCWIGTNAKGRVGIFPKSHIDESLVMVEECGYHDEKRPATPGFSVTGKGRLKGLFRKMKRTSIMSSRDVVEII